MKEELHTPQTEAGCYHVPVLRERSVELLVTDPDGIYIDATFGGGGHTRCILEQLSAQGHLYGFDQDPDAAANAPEDERFTFIASNFRYAAHWMEYYGVSQVQGILADLGVSSHHFDTPERGFSFRFEEALPDMRMNPRAGISAAELINSATESELADILYQYGELHDARQIAAALVKARTDMPIQSMERLVACLQPYLPHASEQRRNKLSRIFQAFRIEINDELGALKALLTASEELLPVGGRIAILTYHSLEDRIVKQWLKQEVTITKQQAMLYGVAPRLFKAVNNKPITAGADELARNSRSRSAKLRVAERQ